MIKRLSQLPWGWIVVALAYIVAILPIDHHPRLFWLGLATAAAYLVLARRTTHTTVVLAQRPAIYSLVTQWLTTLISTLKNTLLLIPPFFSLSVAAADFVERTPAVCTTLLRAYCLTNAYEVPFGWGQVLLSGGVIGLFLLLDHALLVALTLLFQKYLAQSDRVIANIAVGFRIALACLTLTIIVPAVSAYKTSDYAAIDNMITDERTFETLYPAFEPLITNGIFLSANILNRGPQCNKSYNTLVACPGLVDNRPFIAHQLFIAALSAMLYSMLIAAVLGLTLLPSAQAGEKSKRGI